MLGYWAMGRVVMASMPASMITMASTQAKIGRSMKKLTMVAGSLRHAGGGRRSRRFLLLACGTVLLGHDLTTRFGELNSLDDHAIARTEPRGDQPLVADRAVCLQHAQLHHIVRTDDERGRLALLVVTDSLLGREHGPLAHAFLDTFAHEHTGQQESFGIGHEGAQSHRTGRQVDRDLGELERAWVRIVAAVFQLQTDLRLSGRTLFQLTRGSLALEA